MELEITRSNCSIDPVYNNATYKVHYAGAYCPRHEPGMYALFNAKHRKDRP